MLSAKVNKVLDIGLKVFIFIVAYGFLFYELFSNDKWENLSSFCIELKSMSSFYQVLLLVILLMPINWGIETFKWKYLIRKKENIHFLKAFYSVLAGVTISSFMPGRMGEFIGRIFILKKTSKWKGTFISLAGSFSQLIATILSGFLGLLYLFISKPELQNSRYICIVTAISGIMLFTTLFLYFNFNVIQKRRGCKSSKRYRKWNLYSEVLSSIPKKDLLFVLCLSIIRYTVFATQFYLLFYLCGIRLAAIELYSLIAIIYFIMACIPSFAVADLGIRGSVAIMVFKIYFSETNISFFSENMEWAIVTASTIIWFVNLLIPAIAGSFFLYTLHFFKKKSY